MNTMNSEKISSNIGLYIHWPFCLSKCPYCDFNSHVSKEKIDQSLYSSLIKKELDHYSEVMNSKNVSSIFFGGGTPSLMDPSVVYEILNHIEKKFNFDDKTEITLEANPTSVELDKFRHYSDFGINRVSIGVQSLNDIDLKKINPVATLDFGTINTNWKFLIENFIEPYHVQFVHKTTTNQPLKDHYTIVDGVCYGSGVNVDKEDDKNDNALSVTSKYLSLFPNFIIGTYFPNQIGVYLNVPISPGLTSQKRIIYTTDGKDMSKKEIQTTKDIWSVSYTHLRAHET